MLITQLKNMYRQRLRIDLEYDDPKWELIIANYNFNELYKEEFVTIFQDPTWSWDLLHFTKQDLRIYQAAINYACLSSDSAAFIYDYKLYMNDVDKHRLYDAIIHKTSSSLYALKHNIEFKTIEDRKVFIMNSLGTLSTIEILLEDYYTYLDDELKDSIVLAMYNIADYYVINMFYKDNIPYEFKEKIFFEFFSSPSKNAYQRIFEALSHDKNDNDIRHICFNYIINVSAWGYWKSLQYPNNLLDDELEHIYAKYGSTVISLDEKKFDVYYQICKFFNKYLSKEQRMKLVKMLKAKSRYKYIENALNLFNFDDDEKRVLLNIKYINDLR